MKSYTLIINICGRGWETKYYDTFTQAENLILAYRGACDYKLYHYNDLIGERNWL